MALRKRCRSFLDKDAGPQASYFAISNFLRMPAVARAGLAPPMVRWAYMSVGATCSKCSSQGALSPVTRLCGACVIGFAGNVLITAESVPLDRIFSYLDLNGWIAAAVAGMVALNPHMIYAWKFAELSTLEIWERRDAGKWMPTPICNICNDADGRKPHKVAIDAKAQSAGASWLVEIIPEGWMDMLD